MVLAPEKGLPCAESLFLEAKRVHCGGRSKTQIWHVEMREKAFPPAFPTDLLGRHKSFLIMHGLENLAARDT